MNAVSIGIFAIAIQSLAVVGVVGMRVSPLSLLPRLLVVIYTMPFLAMTGYLSGDRFVWWDTPAMASLCADLDVMSRVLLVAAIGLLGLLGGIFLFQHLFGRRAQTAVSLSDGKGTRYVLGAWSFFGMVGFALLFSAMHARPQSIFSAGYATQQQGVSAAVGTGLNAAYLISYLLVIVAAVDVERERDQSGRARLKKKILVTAIILIAVFFQLLCGDRECIGLLVALAFFSITRRGTSDGGVMKFLEFQGQRLRKLAIPGVVVVAVFFALGLIRSGLSEGVGRAASDAVAALDKAYRKNTWTAVAINNAGVADEMLRNGDEVLYGTTYLEYFYSLPPGVLCRLIGIERPIERESGPVWWYPTISAGGIHVTVVPYRNFGLNGLFVIMLTIGFVACIIERNGQQVGGWNRMLYGAVTMSSFMWFWYGDMIFIRAIMGVGVASATYSCLAVVKVTNQRKNSGSAVADSPIQGAATTVDTRW